MEFTITNNIKDGLGAQLMGPLTMMIFSELNELKYLYKPVIKVCHNFNEDPDYEKKIEEIFEFDKFCKKANINTPSYYINQGFIHYLFGNAGKIEKSNILKEIRSHYYKKNPKSKNEIKKIAIHIRRPSKYDTIDYHINDPEDYYIKTLIKVIKENEGPFKVDIYSLSKPIDENLQWNLRINEDIIKNIYEMMDADYFIGSISNLSYLIAYIRGFNNYFPEESHNVYPRLNDWK